MILGKNINMAIHTMYAGIKKAIPVKIFFKEICGAIPATTKAVAPTGGVTAPRVVIIVSRIENHMGSYPIEIATG